MKKIFLSLLVCFIVLSSTMAQIINESPVDGLFPEENGTIDKKPIPYPPIRKADVMWKKRIWREIDFRQKFNQKFYYPTQPQENRKAFINVVLDALKEGQISAWDVQNNPADEFLIPITYNEVRGREIDTINTTVTSAEPPYNEVDTTIYTQFTPNKVQRLRIKEDWYFDKQRSQMMVRIIALCPVIMKEVNGQEVPSPLFWISYAETRDVFAQALVFNEFNSAMRLNYDELFWKRLFNSYIYKEENVYDRRIGEYATGVDALLESERVKNEMFSFEEDLWEY